MGARKLWGLLSGIVALGTACVPLEAVDKDGGLGACAAVRCASGTHCEESSECANGVCFPQASCVPDPTDATLPVAADAGSPVAQDAAAGAACGDRVCPDGLVCCNASCGMCAAPDMACIQIACEPGEPMAPSCASTLCAVGTICIEGPGGPACVPQEENPCNLVDCMPDTTCVVQAGEAVCLPVEEDAGPGGATSCALVLCPPSTYCDDISGSAECLPLPSCEGTKCKVGQHCELMEVQCIRAPCPPLPACVDDVDDPCATVRCKAGTHCEAVEVRCIRAPCPPIAECVADGITPVTCGDNTCGDGQYCCNASCGICAPRGGACIQIACDPKI